MNDLCRYIDHTLLAPDATAAEIDKLCREAIEHQFKSVCVNSRWAGYAAAKLEGHNVLLCCVVGFPLGATATPVKAFEASYAALMGAREIDMVIDIGAAKDGLWDDVTRDVENVVKAVKGKAIVKAILETCLLSDEQKRNACICAINGGAQFIKTSTGFSKAGATEADVRLIRDVVGADIDIKASGGIRTKDDALRMIAAGASRIGTSRGVAIIKQ